MRLAMQIVPYAQPRVEVLGLVAEQPLAPKQPLALA